MLPREKIRELTGFGMASKADAYLFSVTSVDEIRRALEAAVGARRQVILRGAGRSYGDASILPEAVAIDLTTMNQVLAWNPETGVIDCEPGVTIEQLWRHCLPCGWWPPVVSGTMFVTLGGALAMNIHGKNNFKVGTLGDHVLEVDCMLADGSIRTFKPRDGYFESVVSSAGTLAIFTRIRLQMKAVQSGMLNVYAESASNWEDQFDLFESNAEIADYMVGWVDCFAKGKHAGRGQFHAAWHDQEASRDTLLEESQDLPANILGVFPKRHVWRILRIVNNPIGVRLLNLAKYYSSRLIGNRSFHRQSLVAFSFLLDYVPDWRNSYLPDGFIQYQSFIPTERAHEVFRRQIELCHSSHYVPYLGVLKKHRPDNFMLSHGVDGYSLALDFPATPRRWPELLDLAHRMNNLVREAGGRFYLAKDSTLRPEDYTEAATRLKIAKDALDPDGLFSSSLAERIGLVR